MTGLLTIGAFAKASRLSPKALRLYDELGLLVPARVDPGTGYRHYAPEQLEQARLVAWLRRLGMPLARVRAVGALPAAEAAREIRAYWDQVEADTAGRRDLAAFLVDHLSGKDTAMPHDTGTLGLRYAALSDTGLVRETNQDTVYAGSRLLAVADGCGSGGGSASAAAVDALKRLDAAGDRKGTVAPGDLLNALQDAVEQADRAVRGVAGESPVPAETGTTLTALLWTGSRLALVHIGDSRAYLLRGGDLFRITHDHTLVQALLDEGRIGPEEVASHPQRALLARALPLNGTAAPDLRLHDVRAGDRYLLCSDGLSTVLSTAEIRRVVTETADPERAVRELVDRANRCGGPDNVSCVLADVVHEDLPDTP
ncbi:MerR family transcriptional regulator [Streptomyces sp. NPDC023723]|uniref:MerR family transcriptional regulator n=1 Tax=Streptomyces sp. NPDC023723 TaxID=3154323 RepID=UPI0033DEA622